MHWKKYKEHIIKQGEEDRTVYRTYQNNAVVCKS